ncbi:MAG: hypothetical protein HN838_01610 [Rhodospirillaceae bacterium]|nr:hypothetical protein [Rhodospirillaceae bacterium]
MFGLTVRVTTMPVMKAAARSLLIALMMMAPGPAVFGLGFGPALADGKAEICPSCNQDGTWTNPSTGTTSGPSNVPATPTPEQIRAAERDRLNDLGQAAREHGDLAAAIDYFRAALESDPANDAIRRRLGSAQNNLAVEASARGDYATALRLYQEAALNDPGDDVIRQNLASTREILERQQQEAAWQRQLDTAKQTIGGMLNNLADEWGASGSPGSSDASGDLDFADPGRAETTSDGFDFIESGEQASPPAHNDSSVVDLTFIDPDEPMVVDPRSVKGESAVDTLPPVQAEQLRDAVKSAAPTGDARKTEILLDALEVGNSDWNASLSYLAAARRKFPDDLAVRDAMATLMGIAGLFDDGGLPANFGADMLGPLDDDTGLDYDSWALLRRAEERISSARNSADWQVVHELFEQAQEKNPGQLRLRDWANYTEGVIIGMQQFE